MLLKKWLLFAPLVAFLFAGSASAAWFLKIEGVPGEAIDARHRDWIDVLSLSSLQSPHTYSLTKTVDKASPALMQATATGTHFGQIVLEGTKPSGEKYVQIKLTDCIITSVLHGGSGDSGHTESVSIAFVNIETKYFGATPTPVSKALASSAALSSAMALALAGRITGVSAVAPPLGGLRAAVTVASTGPCKDALVDFGDGSNSLSSFNLTGTSTSLPTHPYSTAGAKKVRVGGPGDPGWGPNRKKEQGKKGECTGYAETTVTVRGPQQIQAIPH